MKCLVFLTMSTKDAFRESRCNVHDHRCFASAFELTSCFVSPLTPVHCRLTSGAAPFIFVATSSPRRSTSGRRGDCEATLSAKSSGLLPIYWVHLPFTQPCPKFRCPHVLRLTRTRWDSYGIIHHDSIYRVTRRPCLETLVALLVASPEI